MIRLAHLLSHPIQYKSPLLRRIVQEPDIRLTVFFRSDFSIANYLDPGFGVNLQFDVDLLAGFEHHFLPALGRNDKLSFVAPLNYGLGKHLRNGRFDAIWVHGYGSAYNLYALGLAKSLGLRVLLSDEAHLRSRVRSSLDQLKADAVFAYLRRCVDGFLAIGSANRDYYLHHGARDDRIFLMPYAVDNSWFASRGPHARAQAKAALLSVLGIGESRAVVLFASKLIRRKRCADLVHAFSRLDRETIRPRPLLIVIGDGEERLGLEAAVGGLDLQDDVKFLGFRNQSELPALYHAADVFVLPSDSEPWGLVVNEAMSAGCPVIAAKEVGATRDLIVEGVNGYAFPAGDVVALTQKLATALSAPVWLAAASAASRSRISTWDFEADVAGLRQALGLPARMAIGEGRAGPGNHTAEGELRVTT
jgi:glycosyltransferase involved in cell wall biosynthesis